MEMLTSRVPSKMTLKVGIATEGRASADVLEAICEKSGVLCRARFSEGKPKLFNDFDKILGFLRNGSFRANKFLVVPDLHPETDCVEESTRWNERIRVRFPPARLCLAIWETESWLLSDPESLKGHLGLGVDHPMQDYVGEPQPSVRLNDLFRQAKGYGRGAAFDKRTDGVSIVSQIDLQVASKNSPSLSRFIALLRE